MGLCQVHLQARGDKQTVLDPAVRSAPLSVSARAEGAAADAALQVHAELRFLSKWRPHLRLKFASI